MNHEFMYRKFSAVVASFALLAVWWPMAASSAPSPRGIDHGNLPEVSGDYAVPGRSDLRLRVIVHHGKPDDVSAARSTGKPLPPPPTEVCKDKSIVDLPSDSPVAKAGWSLPSTWTYRINASSVPSTVRSANIETIVGNGYATWKSALGNAVSFEQGADTVVSKAQRDGQNIVTWGRTSGSALAVTYTWYNTVTKVAAEIDTIFNKRFTWYWSDPKAWPTGQQCAYSGVYDAQNILTHELGHTVGLDDEYETELYSNNTMYGYGSTGETKKDTLTSGDIVGVRDVYGL